MPGTGPLRYDPYQRSTAGGAASSAASGAAGGAEAEAEAEAGATERHTDAFANFRCLVDTAVEQEIPSRMHEEMRKLFPKVPRWMWYFTDVGTLTELFPG